MSNAPQHGGSHGLDEEDFDAMEQKAKGGKNVRTSYSSGSDDIPRYRLTEQAFIDNILMDAGTEIDFEGIPGPHMRPLNKLAKEAKAKAPVYGSLNSLPSMLPNNGEVSDPKASIDALVSAIQQMLLQNNAIPQGEGAGAAIEDEIERRVAERLRQAEGHKELPAE